MREDFFWALFGGGFIMFWAVILAWTQHLRALRRLRERELVHKERVLSLEKGIPLPEEAYRPPFPAEALQRLSLAGGLLLLFLGIGVALSFCFAADAESAESWTIGFIPAMAGLGLLLYSWISRRTPAL